jgi:hypothetical protein
MSDALELMVEAVGLAYAAAAEVRVDGWYRC